MKTAIYPGTFDPITHGHTDIIRRAAKIFPRIVVAVAMSAGKNPALSLDQRLALVTALTADLANVEVVSFTGLTVDLADEHGATVLLRGLRGGADLDYELGLAGMNQAMLPSLETVFLAPRPEFRAISASVVREVVAMGGDVSGFVDQRVLDALRAK